MKKRLYIIGAGGFAREVFSWLLDERQLLKKYSFSGFLDDNPEALNGFNYPPGVVGSLADFEPTSDDALICGIGQVGLKRKLCERLITGGAHFESLIHPTVVLGKNVRLGRGVVLCPRVTLTCDVSVGDLAMINCHSSAGHDVYIGSWVTVSAHCDLTGGTEIGEGAFLGSGVSVIPLKRIGSAAVVGAGAVVIKHVADGARVFGNPAREF